MENDFVVEKLEEKHLNILTTFDCNKKSMNEFLYYEAYDYSISGDGQTYLLVDNTQSKVYGYFTLKCTSVPMYNSNTDTYPDIIPGAEIARFAVDKTLQGRKVIENKQTVSDVFFAYAITVIRNICDSIGIRIITLFAIPEPRVIRFYVRQGFREPPPGDDMKFYCSEVNEGCTPMYKVI